MYLVPLFVATRAGAQVSIDFPTNFAGFSSQNVKVTIQNVIRIILGFLGIITVIIILYGGFIWMTASGDPNKVEKAKQIIPLVKERLTKLSDFSDFAGFRVGTVFVTGT